LQRYDGAAKAGLTAFMLILLSPAKTLDETPMQRNVTATQPEFLSDAQTLVSVLAKYSHAELAQLMQVSDAIAALNVARFQDFALPLTAHNAKPALFSFQGDVYKPIRVEAYSDAQLAFAQEHVRILSGLYGVLRPLDYLYPYRLEMGTRLPNPHGNTLYAFWGDRVTDALNRSLAAIKADIVLNLASTEYSSVVQPQRLDARYVTVHFKEKKGDGYKVIGIHAKKARGLITDFIIQHGVKNVAEIKDFSAEGYAYALSVSDAENITFLRG
jgi:uncharacterized protein